MPTISSFAEARVALLPYAASTPDVKTAYSLTNIKSLLKMLGDPQDAVQVVHVAGTSGKTSTSYYIAAMLAQTGATVGLSVSPHIDEVNERLQVNMEPLAETAYCAALSEFLVLIKDAAQPPTYFELLVALAYWYFAKIKVDYAVMEVGLGGLLDGTNVVTRTDKVCVITDIGIDHAHILGNTIAEIAAQKAGIIQPGNVVFCFVQEAAVMDVFKATAQRQHADLRAARYKQPLLLQASMPAFQRRNWQLAARVAEYIISRDKLSDLSFEQWQATEQCYVPGRMETLMVGDKTLVLDGAHNPQKMQALMGSLQERYHGQPMAALVSFKEGKDITETLQSFEGVVAYALATEFIVSQDMQHRSASADTIAAAMPKSIGTDTQLDNAVALQQLLARPEIVLLITGSFYLLHQLRPLIKEYL